MTSTTLGNGVLLSGHDLEKLLSLHDPENSSPKRDDLGWSKQITSDGRLEYIYHARCDMCQTELQDGEETTYHSKIAARWGTLFCKTCLPVVVQMTMSRCALCGVEKQKKRGNESASLCDDCNTEFNRKELRRLSNSLKRTRMEAEDRPLTLSAWLSAINYFGGLCAYCQEREFTDLEHLIPVSCGGLTTIDNCLPACRECNISKTVFAPYEWLSLHPHAAAYLDNFVVNQKGV